MNLSSTLKVISKKRKKKEIKVSKISEKTFLHPF